MRVTTHRRHYSQQAHYRLSNVRCSLLLFQRSARTLLLRTCYLERSRTLVRNGYWRNRTSTARYKAHGNSRIQSCSLLSSSSHPVGAGVEPSVSDPENSKSSSSAVPNTLPCCVSSLSTLRTGKSSLASSLICFIISPA